MFHMINKRALLLEVWCTLIILNFYLFQKNFANLRGPKWVLFRLKRFLLEALSTNDFIRTLIVKDNVCGRIFFRRESTTKTSHMLASGLRRRLCVVLIKCSIGWLKFWPAERSVFLMRYFSHSDRMRLLCVCWCDCPAFAWQSAFLTMISLNMRAVVMLQNLFGLGLA